MAVRAEVGWLPGAGVSRRGRGLPAEPRREAARPLLSRAARAAGNATAEALRRRWRDRDRRAPRPGLRGPAAAAASGRLAGGDALEADSDVDGALGSPVPGRPRSEGDPVLRA